MFYLFNKGKLLEFWAEKNESLSGLSGDSTHMMRGEVGALQFCGCLPLLYKEGWELSLPTHLLSSLSPSSRCSTSWSSAWRSHGHLVSPPHHAVLRLEFPVDPLLPLPRWIKGMEVVIKPYVWPSAEALPDCSAHLHDLEIDKCSTTSTTRFDWSEEHTSELQSHYSIS